MPDKALAAEVLPGRVLHPALAHVASSDSTNMCLRCSSEAISRVGSAGRPVVDLNLGSQACPQADQSIGAASLASSYR